jgi:hypothetical protein
MEYVYLPIQSRYLCVSYFPGILKEELGHDTGPQLPRIGIGFYTEVVMAPSRPSYDNFNI